MHGKSLYKSNPNSVWRPANTNSALPCFGQGSVVFEGRETLGGSLSRAAAVPTRRRARFDPRLRTRSALGC